MLNYKVRLAARNVLQTVGIDFHKFSAPVLKYATVGLIFSVAALFCWQRRPMDVRNALNNVSLQEEIHACQPKEFVVTRKVEHVNILRKALYGLRQASREWNLFFSQLSGTVWL